MKFVVAIDGTAASGKGTLGKKIAEHFDFHYLDTVSYTHLTLPTTPYV